MLILYQFPISHYCEKVRWALDFKGIPYRAVNLLPGAHTRTTRRLARRTSVPVLVDAGRTLQGSADIITYLDQAYPAKPLTPESAAERTEAEGWEQFVDEELGVHVRRICYHVLLDHPKIVIPFFTHNGPWYGSLLLRTLFSRLANRMRAFMDINEDTAAESLERLDAALDVLEAALGPRRFLVGERFSRADLAVAALLAPMVRPKGYGLEWPANIPQPLGAIMDARQGRLRWVVDQYDSFREAAATAGRAA